MPERNQWEYMNYPVPKDVDEIALHDELQSLGKQGWEATTVVELKGERFLIMKRTAGWG
jgi:hypothetical protein